MSKARRNRRLGPHGGAHAAGTEPTAVIPGAVAPVEQAPVTLALTMNANDLPVHEVDERALLGLMEDWRNGRASKNLLQAMQDAYIAILATLIIGGMLVSSLVSAQGVAAACSSVNCTTGRGLLPWAAMFAVFAFTLMLARMFGPVLASAAEGFWLMEAPISRRRLLARRLVMALGIAFIGGGAVGALVSALTGSPGMVVLAWAAACGLGASGLTAFSAAEQGAERTWLVRILQTLLGFLGFGALMLVVATAADWVDPILERDQTEQLALVVGGLGLLLMIGGALIAFQRLDRLRRARLVSGGNLVSSMQGAAFALDFGLMRDILVTRQANERGHVRPTRGRSTGLRALVMRDVQRLWRFPRPLFPLAASIVVPYAVQALGMGRLTVIISGVVLVAVLVPFFGSLRVLSRSKGLARSLPFTTAEIRSAAGIVPGVLAIIWAVAVTPAFIGIAGAPMLGKNPTGAAMHAMVTAVAGYIGAIRWVSAKPPNYQAPMMATEMGAMPPGLILNLVRGLDMVALISLPVLFGGSPWISLVIALIAYSILRMGGIDQEELSAMQEENKRLMEEARAEARAGGAKQGGRPTQEKVKVPRPKR